MSPSEELILFWLLPSLVLLLAFIEQHRFVDKKTPASLFRDYGSLVIIMSLIWPVGLLFFFSTVLDDLNTTSFLLKERSLRKAQPLPPRESITLADGREVLFEESL